MSNNYLQFSFAIKVPESQAGWVRELVEIAEDLVGIDDPDEESQANYDLLCDVFPEWAEYQELGFCLDLDANNECWIYAEESGNTENVVCFLMKLLGRCYEAGEELKQVGFSYSETCSSMRIGQFGGGAIRVFLNGSTPEVEYMNTESWLAEVMR